LRGSAALVSIGAGPGIGDGVAFASRGRPPVDDSGIKRAFDGELGREGDRRREGVIGVVEVPPRTESMDVRAVEGAVGGLTAG